MYFPAISYLRSQVIPESHRANVMNWFRYVWLGYKLSILLNSLFRVPMNIMTCGALLRLHVETISQDKRIVFAACFILCIIGKSKLATMFINSSFLLLLQELC